MDRPDEVPPAPTDEVEPEGGPPPEFLNPESPRYQPWAEKRITNAVKEKRPLREFMAEFDTRVTAYGEIGSGSWDPERQETLLAKFSSVRPKSAPSRRRRRRRPAGAAATQPAPARGQGRRPSIGVPPPQVAAEPGAGAERRRRRRRRPRGGRRPPEAGTGG
ncbi:MAG TPA: hypothetical protein VMW80_06235 [Candidatus Dormibacteraeota bacterium]|nr:hypothetical protein [Candidatus Dormibacteraeota bacterium]